MRDSLRYRDRQSKAAIAALFGAMVAGFLLGGCVVNPIDDEPQTITLNRTLDGVPIRIEVEKGEQWSRRMQAGPIVFNVLPQFAIWAEDEQGRLTDTLYVTGADWKRLRHALKKKEGAVFYEECLPVWASRVREAGGELPGPENPYSDAVTSATPTASFTLLTRFLGNRRPFALYMEINQSGDDNASFNKENNDWAGQPSVIYKAAVPPTGRGPFAMTPVGHGGRIGQTPAIHADLSQLDTALGQVQGITVRFE